MIRLAARNIVKSYGAVRALDDVDFDVHAGAVNVLIGENGAGKSTLMRIVAGVESHDAGTLTLNGAELRLRNVKDAAVQGIGIVHQELSLCPNLSVTANIFLDRSVGRSARIDHAGERTRAAELLARLGASIDPDTPAGALSVGEQQIVEIARALSREVQVLILDEPTSALSAAEIERLFEVIGELRSAGVGIVYISHRMQEIERIGDYVTVLRDGRRVAHAPRGEFSIPWIVEQMLGGAVPERQHQAAAPGADLLLLDAVTVYRANGSKAVDGASLTVRSGQVTAIYGLLGAGRSELFEAICGARPMHGSIRIGDRDLAGLRLDQRLRCGIQLVPEDRKTEGLFGNLAVAQNLSVSVLERLRRALFLSARAEQETVTPMLRSMGVKTHSPQAPIGALSGGNQQKVLIGRSLLPGPRVLLLDEPGRGVDVGARADIFATMRTLAADGVAILFSTSDLMEALTSADRILVMSGGRITADLDAAAASEEALVRAASAQAGKHERPEAA